jgi:phenylpropionate dioxygenase-like ring-hydroxylating dioxygenase large terminal subunit
MSDPTADTTVWNDWHVIAALEQLRPESRFETCLLGHELHIHSPQSVSSPMQRRPIQVATRYGLLWACLGTPVRDIVEFPICEEPDRWIVTGGAVQVAVSGLRVVENFLDLGHLPFVHSGYLGEAPHTEIRPYQVERRPNGGGLIATKCRIYQPLASPVAQTGFEVEYVYEVLRPYCVVLYKSNPAQPLRKDFIALIVQPVDEERCIAHSLLAYLREGIDPAGIRAYMQLIFLQDKPILENQLPKRLPLDPTAEISVRSDAASAVYRRWLRDEDVRYGTITAPSRL